MQIWRLLALALFLVLLLGACGTKATSTPLPTRIAEPTPTAIPTPTATAIPEATIPTVVEPTPTATATREVGDTNEAKAELVQAALVEAIATHPDQKIIRYLLAKRTSEYDGLVFAVVVDSTNMLTLDTLEDEGRIYGMLGFAFLDLTEQEQWDAIEDVYFTLVENDAAKVKNDEANAKLVKAALEKAINTHPEQDIAAYLIQGIEHASETFTAAFVVADPTYTLGLDTTEEIQLMAGLGFLDLTEQEKWDAIRNVHHTLVTNNADLAKAALEEAIANHPKEEINENLAKFIESETVHIDYVSDIPTHTLTLNAAREDSLIVGPGFLDLTEQEKWGVVETVYQSLLQRLNTR